MDPENDKRNNEGSIVKGIISKSASVENQDVTEQDLNKINQFALAPLKADEVFTFKLVMGDNETDDRNYEPFNLNALKDLKTLYVGKTVIKDHSRKANDQIARIYDTELVQDTGKLTKAGEIFTKLIAKCYMVKTSNNADLIQEIKAGIKKEVSTSCRPKHAFCSVCGVDNMKDYCNHFWGKEYETVNGKKICYFTLDGAKDAYEVSFVAVPAQKRAGTTKNYCEERTKEQLQDTEQNKNVNGNDVETEKEKNSNLEKEKELNLRFKMLDSFLFSENKKVKEGN